MAIEIATAYVSLVPSAKGIVGNIAKELAPIEGAAAASGARAGTSMGARLSSSLTKALPTAGGPAGALLGSTGALLGGALVVGFAAALVGIGQAFGAAKNQIIQETGQTGAALQGTFDSVKRVFAEVPASLHDVTTAVDALRQRGVPLGAQLDQLAKQEIELSKITKTDLGANVETTTAIFAKYNVALKDQPAALDAIFKGSQLGGRGVTELLDSLRTGAAAFTQFGFNLNESTALIVSFQRAGVNTGPALAGLRKAFATIAAAGGDPKKSLTDLIASFSDGTPKTTALANAMKLFGTRAGTELATAIQKGKFNTAALLKTITDGKGGILDTAEATRTLGDRFEILKNKAIVALQPLGTAVWAGVKQIFLDLEDPVTHLVGSIGSLAAALAPLAALVGGAIVLAFKAIGPILETFAVGIDAIVSGLSLLPAPVVAAIGALTILAVAFVTLGGATGIAVAALEAFETVSALAGNPFAIAAVAIGALGLALRLFGGDASAASKEAKDLSAALFASADAGQLFKDNISTATEGFTKFLAAQTAADKLGNLNDALKGTGVSLEDVGKAVTGTAADFARLEGVVDTNIGLSGDQAKAIVDTIDAARAQGGVIDGATAAQESLAREVLGANKALQQQADAFAESSRKQLELDTTLGKGAGGIDAQQRATIDAIVATKGWGAGLNALNVAVSENTAKVNAQQLATAEGAKSTNDLKLAVLAGTIGVNDATTAAGEFGLSVENAKSIIEETSGALKKFTDAVVGALPTAAQAADDFGKGVNDAFQKVVDAQGQGAQAIADAQAGLQQALNPQRFIDQLNQEAAAIAGFQASLATLISAGFGPLAAVLAQKGPEAAGVLAKSLASDPAKAKIAAGSVELLAAATSGITTFATDNAAAFGVAGVNLGKAGATGISTGLVAGAPAITAAGATAGAAATAGVKVGISTGTVAAQQAAQTSAATISAAYKGGLTLAQPTADEIAKAHTIFLGAIPTLVHDVGAAAGSASAEHARRFKLANATDEQLGLVRTAITSATPGITGAAGTQASDATGAFGQGLDPSGKATGAFATAATTIRTLSDVRFAAGQLGNEVGEDFGQGIANGLFNKQADVVAAAVAVAQAAKTAVDQTMGNHSPSKKGAESGGWFVDGIVQGIRRAIPDAEHISREAANRTAAAFTPTASSSAIHAVAPVKATTNVGPIAAAPAIAGAPHETNITINSLDPRTARRLILEALQGTEAKNGFVNLRTAKA